MKVLLNITIGGIVSLATWQDCAGIKLVELPDGSFDLCVTTDVEGARKERC